MARLIGILVTLASLAACSSGVSNSGAGAAGTDCGSGDLNLICTANLAMGSTTVDAYSTDTATGTLTITVTDPLGTFSHIFEGVTFDTYHVNFTSSTPGAPVLGTRAYSNTLTINLVNHTGTGSVTIPIADSVTLKEFRDHAKANLVYTYLVTVQAFGRDFAANKPVLVVAHITIQMGSFTSTTTPASSSASAGSILKGFDVALANVKWRPETLVQ